MRNRFAGDDAAHGHAVKGAWSRRTILVVAGGALVMSAAMGVRQTFGLFVEPLSIDLGIPVTLAAFAIALHNLVWGVAQPVAGAAADRFGAMPVVAFGAFAFAAGLAVVAAVPTGPVLVFGMGALVGVGISCTSFGVVLPAVGRALPPERRSLALGWVPDLVSTPTKPAAPGRASIDRFL